MPHSRPLDLNRSAGLAFQTRAGSGPFVSKAGRFFLLGERPAFSSPCWYTTLYRLVGLSIGILPYTKSTMDFKAATTVLTSAPSMTLADVAKAFGKEMHTIARARMEGENSRRPPANWEPVVAQLARGYATELRKYTKELERLADALERR